MSLCKFGCGQEGKFKNKDGTFRCESHYSKCLIHRNRMSILKIGKKYTEETRKKLSEVRRKTLSDYKQDPKNKVLFLEEEIIEDPITGKFLGHCKRIECKNSKENGGWFELKPRQFERRRESILYKNGTHDYFYCCDECKKDCILFNNHYDPFLENSGYTQKEYGYWRYQVLQKQIEESSSYENFCEICHSKENIIVHHEIPKKIDIKQALNPDNGVILCHDCHHKYGHKNGTVCSLGNLAIRVNHG